MFSLYARLCSGVAMSIAILGLTAGLAGCASRNIPSIASAPPNHQINDPSTVDFFVPVITMEQVYSGQTKLQGYRIQIFKDGRGVYHGLKNVQTLGEVRFDIEPQAVQQILDDFRKYKFWDIPADQYGVPKAFAPLALIFTAREGDKTKTVRFSGQDHGGMLVKVIDDQVMSRRWRCPFVDDRNIELCASRDRYASHALPRFLKFEFPKLLDIYK
jgi:Domain of unknown function (DUF6438)